MDIYRVAFFGHRRIDKLGEIEERLVPILRELILTKKYIEFYIGRNGEFDEFVASVIKRVQKQLDRGNSAMILTLPYTVKDIEYYAGYYDEIVIPDAICKAHPKAAITLRNRWMVDTADLVIAYIEHEQGGAYAAVRYAEQRSKKIISLLDTQYSNIPSTIWNTGIYQFINFVLYCVIVLPV